MYKDAEDKNELCVTINAVNSHSVSTRPFLGCSFANDRQHVLADTGAFMCVMEKDYLLELRKTLGDEIRRIASPPISAKSASGHKFETYGVYEVPMKILHNGVEVSWPFLIVGNLPSKVILGSDFFHATDAHFESAKKRVYWPRGFKLPQRGSRAKLRTRHELNIDPQSSLRARMRVTGGQRRQIGICKSRKVYLIEAIGEIDKGGLCDVVIMNTAHEAIKIPRGYDIGEFFPIEDEQLLPLEEVMEECARRASAHAPNSRKLSAEKQAYLADKLREKNISADVKAKLWPIIMRQHEAFSGGPFDLGYNDSVPMKIKMKGVEPVHTKQFPIPWAHRGYLDEYVNELLKKGCIEASRSPYNSPVFGVPKKDGTMRMVNDYRRINDYSLLDRHVIKEVQDCIDTVGVRESRVFSTLDLTSGFWQQELEPNSRAMTAFTIPGKGRFQWKRVPMGLSGSPAAFSRLIEEVTKGLTGVQGYLDDLLVHSPEIEGHLEDLEKCLIRLRQNNLKLNLKKCEFLAEEVPYLGFTLSAEGVRPGKLKLKAVEDFPPPTNPRQIRQFTGLCNYFRHMIPHFSLLSGHLTKLLCKKQGWISGKLPPDAHKAFEELKKHLLTAPILSFPSPKREFILSTDAAAGDDKNPGGLGAVLSQRDERGVERVIAYASRTLRPNEQNYSAYLLEAAAVCWAVDHFHVYIYGNRFTVVTDHRPLETLKTVHKKTLNRLQEKLIEYDFTLLYRPGKDNGPADALSRNALPHVEAIKMQCGYAAIRREQGKDEECRRIAACPRPMTRIENGLLMQQVKSKSMGERNCIMVPKNCRPAIMAAAHDSILTGHQGITKTYRQILSAYWWPTMVKDVETYVKECKRCQESKDPPKFKQAHAPHMPLPVPDKPNVRVHMDLFGPLKSGGSGMQYILVLVDAFTKYAEMVPLPNKEAATVTDGVLRGWIYRHSCPQELVSDRGTEFMAQVEQNVYKKLGIKRKMTAAMHPQSNAQVEIVNKSIGSYMRALLETPADDWEPLVAPLQMAYNNRLHETTMHTPFYLTYGQEARLPNLHDAQVHYGEDWAADRWRYMQAAFKIATDCTEARAARNKRTTDKTARAQSYQEGQDVWVYFPRGTFVDKKSNAKFARQWQAYVIVQRVGEATYSLRRRDKPHSKPTICHADRIKAALNDDERDSRLEDAAEGEAGTRPEVSDDTEEEEEADDTEEDDTPELADEQPAPAPAVPAPTQHPGALAHQHPPVAPGPTQAPAPPPVLQQPLQRTPPPSEAGSSEEGGEAAAGPEAPEEEARPTSPPATGARPRPTRGRPRGRSKGLAYNVARQAVTTRHTRQQGPVEDQPWIPGRPLEWKGRGRGATDPTEASRGRSTSRGATRSRSGRTIKPPKPWSP